MVCEFTGAESWKSRRNRIVASLPSSLIFSIHGRNLKREQRCSKLLRNQFCAKEVGFGSSVVDHLPVVIRINRSERP